MWRSRMYSYPRVCLDAGIKKFNLGRFLLRLVIRILYDEFFAGDSK